MNILVQDTSWVFLVVLANSSNPYRSQASQRLNNSQHLSCLWTISLGVDLQVYQQKYGEISNTGIKQRWVRVNIEYHSITISPKMDMLDMLDSWKCPIVLDMLITLIMWVCVVLLIHHEFDPSPKTWCQGAAKNRVPWSSAEKKGTARGKTPNFVTLW